MTNHIGTPSLDAALLADGVLWRAAKQSYRTLAESCFYDIAYQPATDAAREVAEWLYGRIAGVPAHTKAGMALKLELIISSSFATSSVEEAEGRVEHLADLIEDGDLESAVAYGLMTDFIATLTTLVPTPSAPLASKPRAAKRASAVLPLAA